MYTCIISFFFHLRDNCYSYTIMAIPGSLLETVQSVLNDCWIHELTTDIAPADRIVFDLECCTQILCNFMSSGSFARPSMEYDI